MISVRESFIALTLRSFVEGGTLRTSTLRTTGFAGVHRAAFVITGGTIISDGDGESGGAGRFSLPFADNSITMSGGEVIVDPAVRVVGGTTIDFRMVSVINYNITGGSLAVHCHQRPRPTSRVDSTGTPFTT